MKAAVLVDSKKMEIRDHWDEPTCGPNDVVVEMRGVGICGSDLAIYEGITTPPSVPWVMGHEGVGEIVEMGEAVTDRSIGQQVALEPNYCCFDCTACRSGRTSACPVRAAVGINCPGLLAERVAVPAPFAWPVSGQAALEDLVCTEPVAVAYTAVQRSGVTPADACLVVGAGSQGLFLCQALLALGVRPFVVEPHAERRTLAEWIGARVASAGQGGFDVVFETSGAASALRTAVESAGRAAQVVLIGISSESVPVTSADVVRRQLVVRGSLIYDHPHDFGQAVAEIASQRIRPRSVIAASYPFQEAADAFAAARDIPGKTWITLS